MHDSFVTAARDCFFSAEIAYNVRRTISTSLGVLSIVRNRKQYLKGFTGSNPQNVEFSFLLHETTKLLGQLAPPESELPLH